MHDLLKREHVLDAGQLDVALVTMEDDSDTAADVFDTPLMRGARKSPDRLELSIHCRNRQLMRVLVRHPDNAASIFSAGVSKSCFITGNLMFSTSCC